jgi:hypothetical protein
MLFCVRKLTFLGVLPIILAACAGGVQQQVKPGKTTASELNEKLGQSVVQGPSPLGASAELRTYTECEYQLESGLVTASYCNPAEAQSTLQYWRQIWRNETTTLKPLAGYPTAHGVGRYILDAPARNQSVIYDTGVGRVVKVVEYSKITGVKKNDSK